MIFYLQVWNHFLQCTLQWCCRPNPDWRRLAKTLRYPLFRKMISNQYCDRNTNHSVTSGIPSVLQPCFVSGLWRVSSAPLIQHWAQTRGSKNQDSWVTEGLWSCTHMLNKCPSVHRWWVMHRSRCSPHRCPQHSFIRLWQYRHILTGWWTGSVRILAS